jgi:two-component system sensor histidine kinase KdpD
MAALASVAVITGANYGLREIAPPVSTGVVYLLAVLLVSTYWGVWLGLLTGFLSAAAFNFFHLPPTGTFTLAHAENWVALAVFLVAAIVTSALADTARSRAQEAQQRRQEADLLAEMARLLLGGTSIEESLGAVGHRIAQAFGLASTSVELTWIDSDERRKAIPLIVEGDRVGTVLVPRNADVAQTEQRGAEGSAAFGVTRSPLTADSHHGGGRWPRVRHALGGGPRRVDFSSDQRERSPLATRR